LSLLHRWAGGLIGLLLALIGLTGTILLWEGSWIGVPGASDPLHENVPAIARMVESAAESGQVVRITFAGDEIGLHQIVYRDGGGAYLRQDGTTVATWSDHTGRPELWLFDLHHHLLAGETGETVTGIAGLAGLLFVVSGSVLWWRTRRAFAPKFLPRRIEPGAILRHHRDIGIIAAPLLLLSMTTGVLMVFPNAAGALIGPDAAAPVAVAAAAPSGAAAEAAILQAKARYPDALLRRVTLPRDAGKPIAVRMRQPFEWTPNGRTQLTFDSASGRLLTVEDPARAGASASVREKFYPVHTAKVGGIAMKLPMSLSGLSLTLLGSLAVYGFWLRKARQSRRKALSLKPART
jgi:LPXTG-motif cell wall-anchored protein